MPQGNGLGFVSQDVKDLHREISGQFALKDPFELKPPYRIKRCILKPPPQSESANLPIDQRRYKLLEDMPTSPSTGVLIIKVRLQDEGLAVADVVKGPYMLWAIAEALAEAIPQVSGVQISAKEDVLFCMKEVNILDVQMPHSGAQVWQFCEFRFDYILDLNYENARTAAAAVFQEMAVFERIFCKALEMNYRDIYHLTVLNLTSKQYALVEGECQDHAKRLFLAAQENDLQTIEKLASQVDNVDWRPKECSYPMGLLEEEFGLLWVGLSRTPLLGAAEEGYVEAMRALLDAKADVNLQDNAGFHALYLGAGAEDAGKVVTFLLAQGAKVNLRNKSGYTPIHNACGCGEAGAIKALLEAKADLNIKSNTGAAPVHTAVINNQPASLETLAECRANLDMPAFGGHTPVHEAVMQNNPDIIQKLLDLKADINIESGPDTEFSTPLKMAIDRKKKKAAKKLQALGALEKIDGHEYEDVSEGDFEPGVGGDSVPRVTRRFYK